MRDGAAAEELIQLDTQLPDPSFPPLLNAESLDVPLAPFVTACTRAEAGERGAGDVIWSRDTATLNLAIILEPDVSLAQTQQMVPLTMVALGDAVGVLCPPKVAIQYQWPDALMINGARAGEVKLAAQVCGSADVPRWAVIGVSLQLLHNDAMREPGEVLERTCLAEEGGGEVTRSKVIQSFAAHWLTGLHNWQEDGFRALHDQWLFRAIGEQAPTVIAYLGRDIEGRVRGLDEEAGLKIASADGSLGVLDFGPFIYRLNKDGELVNALTDNQGVS